jgi:hypothetical protein
MIAIVQFHDGPKNRGRSLVAVPVNTATNKLNRQKPKEFVDIFKMSGQSGGDSTVAK